MLKSDRFEVQLIGTHALAIPELQAAPFLLKNQQRVEIRAYFEGNELKFHGKLHSTKEGIRVSFGKRYQKKLGIFPSDYFELQLFENTTKYGVEAPEEWTAVLESDPEAHSFFKALSDGKKRSLIYHVLRVKSSDLRIEKALIICDNLKFGITDPRELIKDRR